MKHSRAWILGTAGVMVFVVLLARCQGSGPERPAKDSETAPAAASRLRAVVLVTIEGLGARTLRANAASAPALSDLAARPENAAHVYTPLPLLLPAMTSLMTGTSPRTHGILDALHRRAGVDLPTLAETFHDNGWSTAAFVASPLVSEGSGLARGFEIFDGAPGYSIASLRYYPQTRHASEFIGNAVGWLESLPVGRSGLLWIQLSDLARLYDLKLAPTAEQIKSRIEAVDEAVVRLRAALGAAGFGASLLVITADRGQILGERGDLDAGVFLEPAAIEVPLLLERIGDAANASEPARPGSLSGLAGFLCDAAGLKARKIPESVTDPALAVSAAPWVSFRWSPAVATLEGDSFWLFDGDWRRFAGTDDGIDVATAQVPAAVAERVRSIVAELAAVPARGPAATAAEVVARKAGLGLRTKEAKPETPGAPQRRAIVELLQSARASEALNRPLEARDAYSSLVASTPPPLAAMSDLAFLQAFNSSTSEPTWRSMQALLAAYGLDRMTLHSAAHAAIAHGDRDLAEAFLLAYLEGVKEEPDALYDLACLASLKNDIPAAQDYLERAIQAGFIWWDSIEKDADLRNLRGSPAFAAVMKKHGR